MAAIFEGMVSTTVFASFMNRRLSVRKVRDSSRNGLQVKGSDEVARAGLAVDACIGTFKKAKKAGCDTVIVHHGIFWRGKGTDKGLTLKRVKFLKRSRMSLYAVHLPLDLHPVYGNNIQLAKMLKLSGVRKFGRYHGIDIGYSGRLRRPTTAGALARRLNHCLGTDSIVLGFGKRQIRSVGIVSGGGSSVLYETRQKGLDCLITGEAPHHVYQDAKDMGLNVILAGHYETETLGVKALGKLIEDEYGIPCVFIEDVTSI